MKRNKLLIAALLTFSIVGLANGTSKAETPSQEQIAVSKVIPGEYFEKLAPAPPPVTPVAPPQPTPPPPIVYTVVAGDSLTKIATAHQTTIERIWQKNTQLTSPDALNISQELVIPFPDEVLAERPLPVAAPVQRTYKTNTNYVSSGNTYARGYCTWYAKSRRPDIPNSLGNANSWYARYPGAKGSVPQVGAIGTTTAGYAGHVVYVEAVYGDGTIRVSEMNYVGRGVVSYRIASAAAFRYLY